MNNSQNSSTEIKTVACPNCKNANEVKIVTVIQADSPERNELFSGMLNCKECEQCDTVFQVDVEQLIYKDVENNFLIVENREVEEDELRELQENIDSLASELAYLENIERPEVRLVFYREDFIEKIVLLERAIDDRLIEFAKFQLFQNVGDTDFSADKRRLLYDFSNTDEDKLQFVIFDRNSGQAVSALHLPYDDFEKVCSEFEANEEMQEELDNLFPSCYVNVDNIIKRIDETSL